MTDNSRRYQKDNHKSFLSVSSCIVCHSSSMIFDYPFGIFVNCLSFFFYDFWLPFRYLRELSVILLLGFLITLSVSSWIVCHSSSKIFYYPFGIFVNYLSFFFYDFWLPFRYLLELSVILLLRFLITLSVSSWIICHSSSTIFDYPFGIFVNYLSFFFYDFWLPFRYLRVEEEWQIIQEDTERVIKNRRRRMTDNSRRYQKSNHKS
jgi:hypothetical protein